MANSKGIEALKGTWDFVDGDSMDDYLKELGVGKIARMMANNAKPRLTISENNGKWTLVTEGGVKSKSLEFTPNVEYESSTADGRKVKGVVRLENGKWVENVYGDEGKETTVTRWVDDSDQHQVTLQVGNTKVHRRFKRAK